MKFQIAESVLATADAAQVANSRARLVAGLTPLFPRAAICAPAVTCRCALDDNLALHRLLAIAPPGVALVCAAGDTVAAALAGELMALDATGAGALGLVVDGPIRDAVAIEGIGFPVFHRGFAPSSCAKARAVSVGEPVELGGVHVSPGDQVIADRDGVLIVPAEAWPDVETAALVLRDRESGIRSRLAEGRRLAEELGLAALERGSGA